jgi:hypothetical protein
MNQRLEDRLRRQALLKSAKSNSENPVECWRPDDSRAHPAPQNDVQLTKRIEHAQLQPK